MGGGAGGKPGAEQPAQGHESAPVPGGRGESGDSRAALAPRALPHLPANSCAFLKLPDWTDSALSSTITGRTSRGWERGGR